MYIHGRLIHSRWLLCYKLGSNEYWILPISIVQGWSCWWKINKNCDLNSWVFWNSFFFHSIEQSIFWMYFFKTKLAKCNSSQKFREKKRFRINVRTYTHPSQCTNWSQQYRKLNPSVLVAFEVTCPSNCEKMMDV